MSLTPEPGSDSVTVEQIRRFNELAQIHGRALRIPLQKADAQEELARLERLAGGSLGIPDEGPFKPGPVTAPAGSAGDFNPGAQTTPTAPFGRSCSACGEALSELEARYGRTKHEACRQQAAKGTGSRPHAGETMFDKAGVPDPQRKRSYDG